MEQKDKKNCESCKKKGNTKFNLMLVFSSYIFITSIYGNVILIEKLINYLKVLF